MGYQPKPLTNQILLLSWEIFWSNTGKRTEVVDSTHAVEKAFDTLFSHIWDYEDVPGWRLGKLHKKLHKELWPNWSLPNYHPMSDDFNEFIAAPVHKELERLLEERIPDYYRVVKRREKFLRKHK